MSKLLVPDKSEGDGAGRRRDNACVVLKRETIKKRWPLKLKKNVYNYNNKPLTNLFPSP